MTDKNETWAVVEMMGHLTIAGRVTRPGEYGGLWQIDVPDGDTFRTEFFGSQSVYRIRIVSEDIARAYAQPGHDVVEYDAPIVSREEHETAMNQASEKIYKMQRRINELERRLVAVNALPANVDDNGIEF